MAYAWHPPEDAMAFRHATNAGAVIGGNESFIQKIKASDRKTWWRVGEVGWVAGSQPCLLGCQSASSLPQNLF